jgi:CheY-like chemotaxis protein
MRAEGDAEATEALGEARAAAMRAAELTSRLLSFARQQTLQPSNININDLVSRMAAILRRTLGESIVITAVPASGLWTAFADPSLVEDALLNLTINARDAMPNGGTLSIETANVVLDKQYAEDNAEVVPGRYVMLAVTDSGTGLGLSMVYGTAKQSGGHLKIYSEVGHGTTVRLYLPRSVTDAEPDVASAEAAKSPLSSGNETILMVEDNVAMGQVTNRTLVGLGYRVLRADDAAAALAIIDGGEAVDLLFTDMVMPGGMTGRELAAEVRKRRPDLPVLFTSGYAGGGTSNGKPAGEAINILAKPYRRQELARRIRDALDGVGTGRADS